MKRYHINKLGQVSVCRAKPGNCPLMPDNEHVEAKNIEEAQKKLDKRIIEKIKNKRNRKIYTIKKLHPGPIYAKNDAMESQDYEDFMSEYDPSLDPSDENYITDNSWDSYEEWRDDRDNSLYKIKSIARHNNMIPNKANVRDFVSDLSKVCIYRKENKLIEDLKEYDGVDTVVLYDINHAERDPSYQEFANKNYKDSHIMDDDYVTEEKWASFKEHLDETNKNREDLVTIDLDEETRVCLETSETGEELLKSIKKQKQEQFFRKISFLAKNSKGTKSGVVTDDTYKEITLLLSPDTIKEIEEWAGNCNDESL